MDDGMIVELFLKRDETAIAEAASKYGAKLRSVAFRICGNGGMSEECENDAYLAAWNSIPPHEPRSYLFSYLAKLARASALNRVKAEGRLKRRAELVELSRELEVCLPAECSVESEAEGAELTRAVNAFLLKQSEEKRALFIRRYWYADSIEELARDFGMSREKVKTTLFRLRAKLREHLEKEDLIYEKQ